MKIFSKNTWGVDVNNAWPLTCKASCLKKIELHPLISGFDFALLEVQNLCVASRLLMCDIFIMCFDLFLFVTCFGWNFNPIAAAAVAAADADAATTTTAAAALGYVWYS